MEVVAERKLVVAAAVEKVAVDNIGGIAVADIAAVGNAAAAAVEVPDSIAVVVADNPFGYWSSHNTQDLHLPRFDLEVEELGERTISRIC